MKYDFKNFNVYHFDLISLISRAYPSLTVYTILSDEDIFFIKFPGYCDKT